MYYRDGNHHKTPGNAFLQHVLTKREFSDLLRTKFSLCRKIAKVAEYPTDIEVILKQVILAVSRNYRINPVFERLIMTRICYASWRANS